MIKTKKQNGKRDNAAMRKALMRISVVALMSALGFVLMLLEIPLPFLIPSFVKFDFSEVPSLIATYMFGPVAGVVVCLIKNLLKALFFTMSGGVGEIANFLIGCALVLPARLVFKKVKSGKSLMVGGMIGSVIMGVLSLPINYYITYPVYSKLIPMEQIIELYQKIIPSVDGLFECLLVFNTPFTLVKGVVSTLIAYVVCTRIKKIRDFQD